MNYYILVNDSTLGPFDLVTIIRKTRNGSITRDTLLQKDGMEQPAPADKIEEIKHLFDNAVTDEPQGGTSYSITNLDLLPLFVRGWKFLKIYQQSMLYSSIMVLVSLLVIRIATLNDFSILSGIIIFFLLFFTFSSLMLAMLRLNRGQPLDAGYFISLLVKSLFPMLAYSGLITAASMVIPVFGAILLQTNILVTSALLIPSFFIMLPFIFTPLFISDQNMGPLSAMRASLNLVVRQSINNIGVIFSLFMTNIIFGLLVLPLIILIPMTFSGFAEIYEENSAS